MDSVEKMNEEWKKLADELEVNIENEMAQISIIQNEWKEEKSRIQNIMDSKASPSKSTLKGEYYEIEKDTCDCCFGSGDASCTEQLLRQPD